MALASASTARRRSGSDIDERARLRLAGMTETARSPTPVAPSHRICTAKPFGTAQCRWFVDESAPPSPQETFLTLTRNRGALTGARPRSSEPARRSC
jgi:hypothetical protein